MHPAISSIPSKIPRIKPFSMSFSSPDSPDSQLQFTKPALFRDSLLFPGHFCTPQFYKNLPAPHGLNRPEVPAGAHTDCGASRNHSPPRAVLSRRRQSFPVGCRYQTPQPQASTCDCPAFGRLSRTTAIYVRSERMGQTKSIDLPEPGTQPVAVAASSKGRLWFWALVFAAFALGGWYYRNSRNASPSTDAAAPAAPGKGKGGFSAGNMVVPVVVATAQRGDLPVYFNGLGTVSAFNTVTVRSRVDGQLISIAFKEGQFVHEGDLLAQIDPRPFQVQLAQAQGQLAKD